MNKITVIVALWMTVVTSDAGAVANPRSNGVADLPPFIHVRPAAGTNGGLEQRFLTDRINELEDRSPTFSEMLRTLGALPPVTVLLAPRVNLLLEDKLIGRTTLRISEGILVAWVDVLVDRERPDRSVEAIGHELAHVFEASCLKGSNSIVTLQSELEGLASMPQYRSWRGGRYETQLPSAVGRAVVREWAGGRATSQFQALTKRYGLGDCIRQSPRSTVPPPIKAGGY